MEPKLKKFVRNHLNGWIMNPEDIGGGASSHIISGILKKPFNGVEEGKEVALKIPKNINVKAFGERFKREIETLEQVSKSEYVVDYYGHMFVKEETVPIIVMERANFSLGDIYELEIGLNKSTLDRVVERIARAIGEVHGLKKDGQPIVHRDIKPKNFGCFGRNDKEIGIVKLLDFGSAGGVYKKDGKNILDVGSSTNTAATFQYSAPEEIVTPRRPRIHYSRQGDIYSLALVYVFLVANDIPFEETRFDSLPCPNDQYGMVQVKEGKVEVKDGEVKLKEEKVEIEEENYVYITVKELIEGKVSQKRFDLVMRCLDPNPRNRPKDVGEFLDAYFKKKVPNLKGFYSDLAKAGQAVMQAQYPSIGGIDAFVGAYQRLHTAAQERNTTKAPELQKADDLYEKMLEWYHQRGLRVFDKIPNNSVDLDSKVYERNFLPILAGETILNEGTERRAAYVRDGKPTDEYRAVVDGIRERHRNDIKGKRK